MLTFSNRSFILSTLQKRFLLWAKALSSVRKWLTVQGVWLDSSFWLDYLNLTAWFSCHEVSFRLYCCSTDLPQRTTIPLFTNLNVTACQSTHGHQERTQNSCQQSLYNIPIWIFWILLSSLPSLIRKRLFWTLLSHHFCYLESINLLISGFKSVYGISNLSRAISAQNKIIFKIIKR